MSGPADRATAEGLEAMAIRTMAESVPCRCYEDTVRCSSCHALTNDIEAALRRAYALGIADAAERHAEVVGLVKESHSLLALCTQPFGVYRPDEIRSVTRRREELNSRTQALLAKEDSDNGN